MFKRHVFSLVDNEKADPGSVAPPTLDKRYGALDRYYGYKSHNGERDHRFGLELWAP